MVEYKYNNPLPFQETTVYRRYSQFQLPVYKKPIHSGLYLQYISGTHLMKTVKYLSLFVRAIRCCNTCMPPLRRN